MSTDPSGTPDRRAYHSPQRAAQADATRRQIVAAARALFLERGWAGTRMRDVAALAGVAEPTVFAVFGSKAGLALGLLDLVDAEADVDRTRAEAARAQGDPHAVLAAFVGLDRRLYERAGDLVGLLRDAGSVTPELAQAYAHGVERGDVARRAYLQDWPPDTLITGNDVEGALARYAAVCNIDGYRLLRARGWSPDRIESWWLELVTFALLGAARPDGRRGMTNPG
jgi:AcrR family transcriptional regulator